MTLTLVRPEDTGEITRPLAALPLRTLALYSELPPLRRPEAAETTEIPLLESIGDVEPDTSAPGDPQRPAVIEADEFSWDPYVARHRRPGRNRWRTPYVGRHRASDGPSFWARLLERLTGGAR